MFCPMSCKVLAANIVLLKQTVIIRWRFPEVNNRWHFLSLSRCLRALSLCLCLWFSGLQPQCRACNWFKYHPISLTCTDRAARANYIHLVMWPGFQVVNILWQHALAATAATHQCSYIIPQLRMEIRNIPLNTHSSRSWQCKHDKWEGGGGRLGGWSMQIGWLQSKKQL